MKFRELLNFLRSYYKFDKLASDACTGGHIHDQLQALDAAHMYVAMYVGGFRSEYGLSTSYSVQLCVWASQIG